MFVTPPSASNTFASDGARRLTATTSGTGIGSSTMRYDGLDNITYYKNKKHTLDYTYSAINRLQSVASSGVESKPYSLFAYDDPGNITHNSYHDFIYNRANQLVESGGNVYTYDAYNRRVVIKQGAKTTYSFYSQSGKLFYTETGGAGINYIYLGSRLIAKDGVIPENGNKQHYLPFGASIEGEINDVGYTGHKFDKDIGLSYMQARYYDPVIGRFMSPDPIGSADQFNLFAYVGNDPVNMVDPTGKVGFLAFLIPMFGGGATATTTTVAVGVTGIGATELVATAVVVGTVANAVNVQNMNNESSDPLDGVLEGAKEGDKTKGRTTNLDKPGGIDQANEDFEKLVPNGSKEITDSKGGKGRTGEMKDGRRVNVRPNSSDGRPTVEIQEGKNKIKIRYDD